MFNKIVVFVLVLLIIPTFFSLLRAGFFPMQDDLQAFRIHQMDKCFQDFQIPCRWVPDMGYGFGYPQFNFYPPAVFYFGELIHLAGFQFIDSVKILFGLGFILSALAMFLFLRAVFGVWPAFFGAILYTYTPFKATEVYVRGSISEFWAFIFFPLIFWSIYQIFKVKKLKYFIYLSFTSALLLLTHNLMSMIFFPIVLIWILSLAYVEKNWRIVGKIIAFLFLGFSLAAFYLLPAVLEKPYVHLDSILSGYFDYRQHFVSIHQLFISNYWGFGSSVFGLGDEVSLSAGQIHWAAGLLGLILAVFNFKQNKKIATLVIILSTLALGVLFMIHERSSFIWSQIPLLHWLQFPWRFLALSTFLLSILSAALIYFLSEKLSQKYIKTVSLLILIVTIIVYGRNFQPANWLDIADQDKFSGSLWEKQLTISIFDYLPIYGQLPPNKRAPELPEILDGDAKVTDYKKGSNFQHGEIEVSERATIRLPLFDFPGMIVEVDNQKIHHLNNDCRAQPYCFGLITFSLEKGNHNIFVKLEDTPIRTIGNWISVVSLITVLGVFLKSQKYV
jgi:hypothetical protein